MKKRLMSLLLCLCMVLTLLPVTAIPAAAATTTVAGYMVYSNDTLLMQTDTTVITNTQEVAIGGTPMMPASMDVNIDGKYHTVTSPFTTTIKKADGSEVQSIDTATAGTYTVTVALPADYVLATGVQEPVMTVNVGSTVYENMYDPKTDAKPVPFGNGYNPFNHSDWQVDTDNGGIRTYLQSGNMTVFNYLTIPIPNDAYYKITADLGVTTPTVAESQFQPVLTIGIVEDTNGAQVISQDVDCNWILADQKFDGMTMGGVTGPFRTERFEAASGQTTFQAFPYPATNTIHSVFGGMLAKKGGDVQFLVGIEANAKISTITSYYGTIKNVKLTRLTNSYNISTTGAGSGSFDLNWKDSTDSSLSATGASSKSGTIGRGDTATLTAHAGAGSYFDGWYKQDGTLVSHDRIYSFVAGTSADDASAYNYYARFEKGSDPILSNLVASEHNTDTAMVADTQDGWSGGSGYVSPSDPTATVDTAKPLTMRFTTAADHMNVYFDAALSNMDLYCYLDGSTTPYTLPGESKTIDYAQTDWSAGKSDVRSLDQTAFEFQRSVVIPVAKAGTHTLTFKAVRDMAVKTIDQLQVTDDYVYARLSNLGVTSDKVTLTNTANANCPAQISVNGAVAETLDGTLTVPYNSFVKLVSSPNEGYLADGYTLTNNTLHYYKQAIYIDSDDYNKTPYAVNLTPLKDRSEFAAKADGALTVNSITTEARSTQINSAIVKPGTGETYTWTPSDGAWYPDSGNTCLISSDKGNASYYTFADLKMDFTIKEGEYKKLSFDSYGFAWVTVTKDGEIDKIMDEQISSGSGFTTHSTGYLTAGTYHLRFKTSGQNALRLKNFTLQTLATGKIAYYATALAPYGDNPDISETVNGWSAWTASTSDVVEGQPITFTYTSGKAETGYALQSIAVNGTAETLSDSGTFTYTPTAADVTGLTVSLVYTSPYLGVYQDTTHKKIYANGYSILVSGNNVYYYDAGAQAARTTLNEGAASFFNIDSGYTVYGGGYQQNVERTDVHLRNLGTYVVNVYGGGDGTNVTGDSNVDLAYENVSGGGLTSLVNIFGGGFNGSVGGNVNFTAKMYQTSNLNLYGAGSGGSVGGDVTLNVIADYTTGGGIYGGGQNCAVTGDITTTVDTQSNTPTLASIYGGAQSNTDTKSPASAGNITLTLFHKIAVTYDVSAQGQTGIANNVTLTTSADTSIGRSVYGGGDSSYASGSAANVTMTIDSGTAITGSLTGSTGAVTGKLTINLNNTTCSGGVYTGTGDIKASEVNIGGAYLGEVNIKTGLAAPVQSDASYACGIYEKSGSADGYDVYKLTNFSGITYDSNTKTLYLNGLKATIRSHDKTNEKAYYGGTEYIVYYYLPGQSSGGSKIIAATELNTVYAGAKDAPVGSTDLTIDACLNNSPSLTVYGGGQSATAKVLTDTKLSVVGYPNQTFYGGGKDAPVLGSTNLTYTSFPTGLGNTIKDTTADGTAVAYGGCENANVSGDSNLTIVSQKGYSGTPDSQEKWLLYGSGKSGSVGGNINITYDSKNIMNRSYKGVYALSDGAFVTGKVNLHANAYMATPFYLPSDNTSIDTTNANIDAEKTLESGVASGTYTIQTKATLESDTIYANGLPLLYRKDDNGYPRLYFDNGTIGAYDDADVLIGGYLPDIKNIYLGSKTNDVASGTFTALDDCSENHIYMGGGSGTKVGNSVANIYSALTNDLYVTADEGSVTGDSTLNLGSTTSTDKLTTQNIYTDGLTRIAVNQPFTDGAIRHATVTPAANFDPTVAKLTPATDDTGTKYTCDFSAASTAAETSATLTYEGFRRYNSYDNNSYYTVNAQGNILLGQDSTNADADYVFWNDVNKNRTYDAGIDQKLCSVTKDQYEAVNSNYYGTVNFPAFHVILNGDNSQLTILDSFKGTIPELICIGSYQDILQKNGSIGKITFNHVFPSDIPDATNEHFTVNGANAQIGYGTMRGENITVDLLQGKFYQYDSSNSPSAFVNDKFYDADSYSVKLGSDFTLLSNTYFENFTTADFSAYTPLTADTANPGYYTELAVTNAASGAVYTDTSKCVPPSGYVFEETKATDDVITYRLKLASGVTVPILQSLGNIPYGTDKTVTITDGTPDSTYFTPTSTTNEYKLVNTLMPGDYIAACTDSNNAVVRQLTFTVTPRTLTITPKATITKYVGQQNLWGPDYYTVTTTDDQTPKTVAVPAADQYLLTYTGAEAAGTYAPELVTGRSADGAYEYVLANATGMLTIKTAGDTTAVATISNETKGDNGWYKGSVKLVAPDGYLISQTNIGTATKTLVFTPTDETSQTITYYLKDANPESTKYGAFFTAQTTAAVKVDLTAPTVTTAAASEVSETGATVSATPSEDGTVYVLVKQASATAPTAAEVAASTTSFTYPTASTISITDLTGSTSYIAYVVAKDKSGQLSAVNSAAVFTTKANLSTAVVTLDANAFTYTGNTCVPTPTVTLGSTTLVSSQYTVSYKNSDGSAAASPTAAGTYTVVITASDTGSYSGSATSMPAFTVLPATPTLIWSAQTVAYTGSTVNVTPPTVTLVNSESYSGSFTYSYKAANASGYTPGLPTNAGSYSVIAHIASAANYTAADSPVMTLTVTASNPTVTFNSYNPSGVYTGAALANPTQEQLTLTGGAAFGNVTFTWYKDSVDPANKLAGSPVNAGSYVLVAALPATANTNPVKAESDTITISKADLSIAAKDQTVTYGSHIINNTAQVTSTGLVNSEVLTGITLTASSTAVTTNGTITPSAAVISGGGADNYNITYNAGKLTINKANPIYYAPIGLTAIYGQTLADVTLPFGWAWKASSTNVGNVDQNSFLATYTPSDTTSYNVLSDIPVTISVTKKALTVKAVDQSIIYGNSIASDVTATGLVNSDTLDSVTLTPSTANVTANGTITPSAAVIKNSTTVVTGNYSITYETGVLTVVKSTPAVAFNNYPTSYTYTGTALTNPTAAQLTLTGATVNDVTFTWYKGSVAEANKLSGPPKDVGTYFVTAAIPATANTNASETATSGAITISVKSVTADSGNVTFAGSPFTYTGSAQTPAVTVKDGTVTIPASEYTVSYSSNTGAGTATVTIADNAGGNYTVNGSASFTIAAKAVTVKPKNVSVTVGGTAPTLALEYTGLVGTETITPSVEPAFKLTKSDSTEIALADAVKAAGTYTITWTNVDDTNYNTAANYTVSKTAAGTLTVSNVPVAPPDTGAKVTIPVSSNEGSVKVEATVKDGTAAVTITDAQINEIASGTGNVGTVRMDVSSLDVKAATVPAKVIAAADSSTSATGVEVALPTGTVTLDKTALAAVSDKGGDVTVSVDKVDNAKLTETQKAVLGAQAETALVVDVTVLASGEKVSAFNGGSIGVAVPYTPEAGEDTSKLVVWFINDDGTIEPKTGFYNAETGKYEFQTQHLSQYVLVSFPFKDVSANSWYYGNVAYAYMNGLFFGTSDTTFSPETTMTRGMLVTVLYRMEGSPDVTASASFTDVAADAYYAKAVAWASANKLVTGYDAATFGPNDAITREQMAAILYRYASLKAYDTSGAASLDGFADSASVSDYAKSALSWAVNGGLVKGSDNKLMPGNGATRAQVAAILQRFQQKIVK